MLPSDWITPSALGIVPFAAQWLAYVFPYRRFACALADADARLGADADRYSFIAADFHHLLLAGLPAHNPRTPAGEIRGRACVHGFRARP